MPNPRDVLELIERMRCISSDTERHRLVEELGAVSRPTVLSFLNAHGVNVCMGSDAALAAFRASDVLLRDGIGMQAVLPALNRPVGLNMNGTDFIPLLLRTLGARNVAIYGTATPWLDRARAVLEETTPHRYADLQHGFHPAEHYVDRARTQRPDLILLAMGMPKQEEVAALLKRSLDHPVLIVNGGAIVDFLAGRFKRAPDAVQRSGLEWAFRLAQEPRRLFRRYCIGAFGFAWSTLRLRRAASLRTRGAAPAATGPNTPSPIQRSPIQKEL
ncbi:WecB/TagA/CpsF family glycosyltransferase [Azospirillum picis]|uniref:Exopolysaccharide biosynthesis WecB/TagA/CpsF family protein n=1 Tax=Azospirillum picis TaxID=488438 RepID=A0ABU0MGU4_9PROT|nr:WecB/TagA/CpsF family glycosyltransferase [Azospirillum picis]MBP2299101.1 exopolysaccharide biosynthesis WecB/TagA/CpsF family protein [Azospirillum picis]MDQ0532657.1 exopolysaccharide biosynthesis WecB/TagA/CpsF family protein [Azospirillum picis]